MLILCLAFAQYVSVSVLTVGVFLYRQGNRDNKWSPNLVKCVDFVSTNAICLSIEM